jgi:UrcA family protein
MTRLQAAVAVTLALLAGPTLAQAEVVRSPEQAVVSYPVEKLNTASGRQAVKAEIAAVAERYCRANPVGHTVFACRAEVSKSLAQGVEVQAQAYAKAHPSVEFASN